MPDHRKVLGASHRRAESCHALNLGVCHQSHSLLVILFFKLNVILPCMWHSDYA